MVVYSGNGAISISKLLGIQGSIAPAPHAVQVMQGGRNERGRGSERLACKSCTKTAAVSESA